MGSAQPKLINKAFFADTTLTFCGFKVFLLIPDRPDVNPRDVVTYFNTKQKELLERASIANIHDIYETSQRMLNSQRPEDN